MSPRQKNQRSGPSAGVPDVADAPAAARLADALIVRRVQAGEPHAYAELVRKYQDRVYHACLRICGEPEDAADLTQDAFLKAFAAIDAFRGASAFYTWIFRIAVNLSVSQQRRQRNRATLSLDADADERGGRRQPAAPPVDPAAGLEAAETRSAVATALAALDPEHRVAVVLRDIEGCDYQEIADILELPIGTVKSRIFRGRMTLRARLAPEPPKPAKRR